MPTSDPIDVLLAYDRWATRQILDVCANLSPEQFHRPFEMGPGSLHDTLTHMLAAMRVWADVLANREQRPRLEGEQRTVTQLVALLEETAADLAASSHRHPLNETVTRTRDGHTHTYTRGGVLAHVATHGAHHRAQCLNMLRHVGVNPLPPSSVAEWQRTIDIPS